MTASTCTCTAAIVKSTVPETWVEPSNGGGNCASAAVLTRTARPANPKTRRNMITSFREDGPCVTRASDRQPTSRTAADVFNVEQGLAGTLDEIMPPVERVLTMPWNG